MYSTRYPDVTKTGPTTSWSTSRAAFSREAEPDRVLYRLPQVLEARATGRTIFVAEGEKDCDALAGFPSAIPPTNRGG